MSKYQFSEFSLYNIEGIAKTTPRVTKIITVNNFQRIFDAQIIDGKIKKAYLYQRDMSDREIK